jgi:hypothetical protein
LQITVYGVQEYNASSPVSVVKSDSNVGDFVSGMKISSHQKNKSAIASIYTVRYPQSQVRQFGRIRTIKVTIIGANNRELFHFFIGNSL